MHQRQPNTLAALLDTEIPDPTDFDDSALRKLDTALRCTICSEWFEAPVTLTCGHGFCSLCARRHIDDKGECPSCRHVMNEGGIKADAVMEEVVSAWTEARPRILQILQDEQLRLIKRESAPVTPKHTRTTKKRKRAGSYEGEIIPTSDGIECISGPSTVPSRRSYSNTTGDDEDDAALPIVPTSDSVEEVIEEDLPKGWVQCPICNTRVKEQSINAHIDNGCQPPPLISTTIKRKRPTEKKKPSEDAKNQWNKLFAGTPGPKTSKTGGKGKEKEKSVDPEDRLPKITYALCKDRELKTALSELGLPVTGNRQDWESRHSKYLMMYNANLDKSAVQRKTAARLRLDLHQEEQQSTLAKKREKEKASSTKAIAEDPMKYVRNNKSEFDKLVSQARAPPVKYKPSVPAVISGTSSSKHVVDLPDHGTEEDVILVDSEEEGTRR